MDAVLCWIGISYAHLKNDQQAEPSVREYDVSPKIRGQIRRLEGSIRPYRLGKKALYNILQQTYDEWCEEWRTIGMKYEADELQYYLLKARMKWNLFNLAPCLLKLAFWLEDLGDRFQGSFSKRFKRIKGISTWIERFFDTFRSIIEWSLYSIGKSLVWPLLLFVVVPILFFTCVYYQSKCVSIRDSQAQAVTPPACQSDGTPQLVPTAAAAPAPVFIDNLAYSIIVFTDSDSGSLSVCANQPYVHRYMAAEALLAYISMLVVVGYLVNRLSSR
jgi:hypothetical protein